MNHDWILGWVIWIQGQVCDFRTCYISCNWHKSAFINVTYIICGHCWQSSLTGSCGNKYGRTWRMWYRFLIHRWNCSTVIHIRFNLFNNHTCETENSYKVQFLNVWKHYSMTRSRIATWKHSLMIIPYHLYFSNVEKCIKYPNFIWI